MSERVIKFRIYDMVEKVMLSPPPAYMLMEIGDGTIWFNDGHGCGDRLESKNPNIYQLMQFTGLYWDGKEVFEGDIFNKKRDKRHKDGGFTAGTYAYHPENSNVVEYRKGCFMVGFGTLQEFLIFASREGHHQDLCGNIYQNPELLP